MTSEEREEKILATAKEIIDVWEDPSEDAAHDYDLWEPAVRLSKLVLVQHMLKLEEKK